MPVLSDRACHDGLIASLRLQGGSQGGLSAAYLSSPHHVLHAGSLPGSWVRSLVPTTRVSSLGGIF